MGGGGAWPGKLCVGHHFSTALKGEGAKKRNTAEGGTKVGATNADIPRQHRGGKQGDDILERRKERGRRGGWRKLGREGRNEFLPQVGDKSSTAGLISFRWLRFHLAERSANFKGHSAGAGRRGVKKRKKKAGEKKKKKARKRGRKKTQQ